MVDTTAVVPACMMNEQVKSYEPTLEDTFFVLPTGDYQRLIFFNMELRDKEQNHLNDFDNFLKTKGLEIPANFDNEHRLVLRFLQKMHWDYQKAHDGIVANHTWRQQVNISDISKVEQGLKAGWIYGYMRDKSQRPVIIINCRTMIDSGVSIEQVVEVADFFLNYVITNGMVPGKVENWTAIFDLRNVGVTELPSKHISSLVKSMSVNYCGRMFKFFATDCNWLVRSMMYMVHKFVDEFTKRKLLTFADDYRPALHEIVAVESLEEKYGGKLPDKKDNFWPPQLN
jgi:hypothetical protein